MLLRRSVGWHGIDDADVVARALKAAVHAVVAEHSGLGEAVGCALLLGDVVSFYYVKDVIVHPKWQSKRNRHRTDAQVDRKWAEANAQDNLLLSPSSQVRFSKDFTDSSVSRRDSAWCAPFTGHDTE